MWLLNYDCGSELLIPTGSAAKSQAALEHLASGCVECAGLLSWLRRAGCEGRLVAGAAPPEHAVEAVKDAFAMAVARGKRQPPPRPWWDLDER